MLPTTAITCPATTGKLSTEWLNDDRSSVATNNKNASPLRSVSPFANFCSTAHIKRHQLIHTGFQSIANITAFSEYWQLRNYLTLILIKRSTVCQTFNRQKICRLLLAAFNSFRLIKSVAESGGKVINGCRQPVRQQPLAQVRAEKPGSAGYKYPHVDLSFP